MSKRIPRVIVIDLLSCIERIQEYTSVMSFDDLYIDSKTRDAVLRNIMVIGEAANRMPNEFRIQHPEIEWSKIIRSRNIVTHDYDDVDYTIIWKIITVHLPANQKSLENILASL
jgi:uncharacterized protein with HEPN domain